jgi:CheY-like chemotaxis protein
VLVVEDEPDARDLFTLSLEQSGAQVRAVAAAAEALEVLKEFKPGVLVSDIGMPVEDGYALLRRVRQLRAEEGGTLPALALTAYAGEEDRRRALEAGYQQHLAKPVTPAELVAAVAELAGRGEPTRAG